MKVTGLNFTEAVQATKDNMENEERRRVRRPCWKGALIYGKFCGLIYLDFKSKSRQPFTPSYDDIMATDYEIVFVPKPMTFQEALNLIKKGKRFGEPHGRRTCMPACKKGRLTCLQYTEITLYKIRLP